MIIFIYTYFVLFDVKLKMYSTSIIFPVKCYNNSNATHIVCNVFNSENCMIGRCQSFSLLYSVSNAVREAYPAIKSFMNMSTYNDDSYPILELQYNKCMGSDIIDYNNVSTDMNLKINDVVEHDTQRMFEIIIEKRKSFSDKCIPLNKLYKYTIKNPDGHLLKKDKRDSVDSCIQAVLSDSLFFILSYMQVKCKSIPALIKIIVLDDKKQINSYESKDVTIIQEGML